MPSQFSLTDEKKRLRSILQGISKEKRVTFAFSESETYDSFADVCEEASRRFPNFSIAALSYFVSKHLEEKSIKHDCVHTRQMGAEYSGLYLQGEQLARQCFKDKATGKDFTEFNGISLGCCVELLMLNFFQAVIKCMTALEIYLKRAAPERVVFFDSGPQATRRIEDWMDFNIFRGLFPRICRQNSIECIELQAEIPAIRGHLWTPFLTAAPPLKIAGFDIRLPMPLYRVFKNLFLLAKNFVSGKTLRPENPNILFASAATMSYLGSNLIHRLLQSKKSNMYVWDGESKEVGIINIIESLTWDRIVRCFSRSSYVEMFMRRFEADREKLRLSTAYRGLSIFELYPFYFENLYKTYFPALVARAELLEKQTAKKKFRALVSHADQSVFERLVLLVGNSLSIPTIAFQHGLGETLPGSQAGFPSVAKYHFVWGSETQKYRMSKGESAQKIKVVGCHLADIQKNGDSAEFPSLGAPGSILYITTPAGQCTCTRRTSFADNEFLLNLILETMKAFPQKTLIIKTRYSDMQIDVYQRMIRQSGLRNIVISDENIVSLIKRCDLFLTLYSTASLEAMMRNKPGIQILTFLRDKQFISDKSSGLPLAEYGAALGIYEPNPQHLVEAINDIYQSGETRERLSRGGIKFMQDHANLGKGDPAENFITALLEYLHLDSAK